MARWEGNGARVLKRVGPGLCVVVAAAVAAVVGVVMWERSAEVAERCVAREEPAERRSVPAVGRWDGGLDEDALLDGVDLKRYKTIICTPETLERDVESILTKDATCEIGIGSDKSSEDHFALSSGLSITRPPGFDRPLLSVQYLCTDTLDCKGDRGSNDVLEVSGRFEVDGVTVDVAVASIPLSAHVSCGEDTAGWNTVTIDLSYLVDFKPVEGNSWRFISVDISADSNAVLGFDNVEYISEQGLTGMLQTQDIAEITNVAHAIPIPFMVVYVMWGFLFLALCKSLRDVWVNRFVPVTRVVATYTVVLGFALAYLTVCIIRYPSVSKDIYDHFHTAVNEQALGLKSFEYVDLGSPAAIKPLLEKQDFPFMLLQERGVLHRTAIPFQDRAKLFQSFSPQLETEPVSQVFLHSAAVLEDEVVAQVSQESLSVAGVHLLFGLGLLAFWRKPETRFLPWMLGILAATTLGISIWFAIITAQANPAETYVAYLETLDSSGNPAFIQVQALADLERDSTSGDLFVTLNGTSGSECYRSEEDLDGAVEAAKGAGISSDVVCFYNNHVTMTGSSECLEYECTGERVVLASKGSQDVKGVTIHGQVSKGASLTLLLFAISNVVVVGLIVLSRRMSAPNPELMKAQVQVSSYVAPGASEMSGAAFANSPWRPTDRSMAGAPSGPDHASRTELDGSWQVPQYSRSQWIGRQDE